MFVLDKYSKMVFRKDNEYGTFYQIGLSKKDRNNNYINGYMQVKFKKGVDVANKTKIIIKNAFIDFYLDKDNKTVPFLMVLEFETEDQKEEDPYAQFGSTITAKEVDELPDLPF